MTRTNRVSWCGAIPENSLGDENGEIKTNKNAETNKLLNIRTPSHNLATHHHELQQLMFIKYKKEIRC